MSIEFRPDRALLHDHLLKQTRLVFEAKVTASATPASKAHASDLSVIYLRTEGKTAAADAIEDLSTTFSTADDGTGVFGILVDDPSVAKFYQATVEPSAGTVSVTKGLSSAGRPYLDIDSSVDLSSTDLTVTCELDYRKE